MDPAPKGGVAHCGEIPPPHILAQVPVPKARVGYKPREIGSNPISGNHLSGDRAGHSCRPYQAITQENDQLAIHSGGIHSTAVTTCSTVTPSTWTPSFPRETSALWSNAKVGLMSDNTSAVAYLRNQEGGGDKIVSLNDIATDICLWAEKRGMTLVPHHLPKHLTC